MSNDDELSINREAVIGQMQNIVYDGWLPVVLGRQRASGHKLDLDREVNYSQDVDASIANSFSTAAFRLLSSFMFCLMYSYANDCKGLREPQKHLFLFISSNLNKSLSLQVWSFHGPRDIPAL